MTFFGCFELGALDFYNQFNYLRLKNLGLLIAAFLGCGEETFNRLGVCMRFKAFMICCALILSTLFFSQECFAVLDISEGDLLLPYCAPESDINEVELGTFSDYKVLSPPKPEKLDNNVLYRDVVRIKDILTGEYKYILVYAEDDKSKEPRMFIDTTLIKGKANLITSFTNGWEHSVGIKASDLEVNTSLRKEIFHGTLFKFEDIYSFELNSERLDNKVLGTISIQF